jgi:hypothetical protein
MFPNLSGFNSLGGLNNYTPPVPNKESLISQRNYLLNQASELESQITKFDPPTTAPQPQPQAQDISKLIAAEVQRQLAGFQQQVQAAAQSPDIGILMAMGEVLPESDQLWLRDNLSGLPKFLASADGKGVVELMIESYRKAIT